MFFNINLKCIFSRLRGDPLQKSACWANKLCLGQKLIRSHVSVVFLNLFRRRSFHASENCSRPRAISFKNVMSQFFSDLGPRPKSSKIRSRGCFFFKLTALGPEFFETAIRGHFWLFETCPGQCLTGHWNFPLQNRFLGRWF